MCDAINRLFAEETAAEKKRADEAESKLSDTETKLKDEKKRADMAEADLQRALAELAALKAASN